MSIPNWNALVEQGRAKAIGISWSEEELHAIYELNIPLEFVRAGCTTEDAYLQAQHEVAESVAMTKKKPLRYMKKDELLDEAQSHGIQTSKDMTRGDLILEIERAYKK